MVLENYFICFESVLPSRICDLIIEDAEQRNIEMARIGQFDHKENMTETDISKLYKTRNSSVVWMDDPWLYREIHPFVHEANRIANWNFDWHYSESCQFTKYSKSQHYSWHQDAFLKPFDDPTKKTNGLIRKLSVTVSLADGDSYEGGDLEFNLRNSSDDYEVIQKSELSRKKGTIVVFPSFVWHRVTPVTKGTRYSLVVWNTGAPYR